MILVILLIINRLMVFLFRSQNLMAANIIIYVSLPNQQDANSESIRNPKYPYRPLNKVSKRYLMKRSGGGGRDTDICESVLG